MTLVGSPSDPIPAQQHTHRIKHCIEGQNEPPCLSCPQQVSKMSPHHNHHSFSLPEVANKAKEEGCAVKRCACIIFLLVSVHVCVHMKTDKRMFLVGGLTIHFINIFENARYAFSEQQVLWSRATRTTKATSTVSLSSLHTCVIPRPV